MSKNPSWDYVNWIHPQVSRTFDLAAEKLSGDLQKDTKIGYLFCRVADTIEDTPTLNPEQKTQYLQEYAELFQQDRENSQIEQFKESLLETAQPHQNNVSNPSYWNLVENVDTIFEAYQETKDEIQNYIDDVVIEMSEGMARFEKKNQKRDAQVKIQTLEEYEEYCHIVAGTVGELMTNIFKEQGNYTQEETETLEQNSEDFGLALQTVNIIKDIKEDMQQELEYLWPEEILERNNLNHQKLKQTLGKEERKKDRESAINEMIGLGDQYLEKTREYIKTLDQASDRDSNNQEILEWASSAALMSEATQREVENDKQKVFETGDAKASKKEVATILDRLDQWIEQEGYVNVANSIRENERSSKLSLMKFGVKNKLDDFKRFRNQSSWYSDLDKLRKRHNPT